jgi:transposase
VFRAKRADRVKLLWWDGTGICLLTKRLEGGVFRWPPVEDGVLRLTPGQLASLLEGLAWSSAGVREVERPRAAS